MDEREQQDVESVLLQAWQSINRAGGQQDLQNQWGSVGGRGAPADGIGRRAK